MVECRNYNVAGLGFSIEAEADVLALLTNYEPFRVEQPTEPMLFHMVIRDIEQPLNLEHVFTDSSDDDMPRIEVYHVGQDWLIQLSMFKTSPICSTMLVSADFKHVQLQAEHSMIKFAIDNAVMLIYAFSTADKGVLEMHASVTVKDGKGFLFLGKSGTGKSTHSRLWLETFPDAWLLNDDNPVLRLLPNNEVRVYGSPWSGKTPCYINQNFPVGGIVKLTQAPVNAIHTLSLPEAYAHMLSSSSGLKIVPDMMDNLYNTIASVIQIIPVQGLECLPDKDAAKMCENTINKQ